MSRLREFHPIRKAIDKAMPRRAEKRKWHEQVEHIKKERELVYTLLGDNEGQNVESEQAQAVLDVEIKLVNIWNSSLSRGQTDRAKNANFETYDGLKAMSGFFRWQAIMFESRYILEGRRGEDEQSRESFVRMNACKNAHIMARDRMNETLEGISLINREKAYTALGGPTGEVSALPEMETVIEAERNLVKLGVSDLDEEQREALSGCSFENIKGREAMILFFYIKAWALKDEIDNNKKAGISFDEQELTRRWLACSEAIRLVDKFIE